MRFEMHAMRPLMAAIENPLTTLSEARKAVRQTTDAAIGEGLMINNIDTWARLSVGVMMTVAEVLNAFDREPSLDHFVRAAGESLEHARNVMDRGLQIGDWDLARQGAVMIEVTCRGIHAALDMPYEPLFMAMLLNQDPAPLIAEYRERKAKERLLAEVQADLAGMGASDRVVPAVTPEQMMQAAMVPNEVQLRQIVGDEVMRTIAAPEAGAPPECGGA